MKKGILMVCVLLAAWGCSAGQLQETAKINLVTANTAALVTVIWTDPNLSDAEKVKATAAVIGQYAQETELIEADQQSAFMNYVEWVWTTYQAWYPTKTTTSMVTLIVAMAVMFVKRQK